GYAEGGTFAAAFDKAEWRVDPGTVASGPSPGMLKVVEWNVERGNELDKVVRLMKRTNADVYLLNETDLYGVNSGSVAVGREIAGAMGYSYYMSIEFYEFRDDRRGTSGNSIVSRYPLKDGRVIQLPMLLDQGGYDWSTSLREPRCGDRIAISAH